MGYIEASKNLAKLFGIQKRHPEAISVLEDCIEKIKIRWSKNKDQSKEIIESDDSLVVKHNKRLKVELVNIMVNELENADGESEQLGDLDFAELYEQLGKHYKDLAAQHEKTRLKLHSEKSTDRELISESLKKFKEFTQGAITAYEECLKLNYGKVKCLINMAYIYHNTGNLKQARDFYERVLEIEPNHKGARENLQILTKYS